VRGFERAQNDGEYQQRQQRQPDPHGRSHVAWRPIMPLINGRSVAGEPLRFPSIGSLRLPAPGLIGHRLPEGLPGPDTLLWYSGHSVTPPSGSCPCLLSPSPVVLAVRDGGAQAVARLRSEWGSRAAATTGWTPFAEPHRSRAAGEGVTRSTTGPGTTLHLDEVFAVCDRTMSTLGQHALYHRLRGVPRAGTSRLRSPGHPV
jgi:hypothetical protein